MDTDVKVGIGRYVKRLCRSLTFLLTFLDVEISAYLKVYSKNLENMCLFPELKGRQLYGLIKFICGCSFMMSGASDTIYHILSSSSRRPTPLLSEFSASWAWPHIAPTARREELN